MHAFVSLLALTVAFLSFADSEEPEPTEDPSPDYVVLTNSRRSVTNLNIETIRGMAWDADQGRLYAVNTHGSTLVYFDSSATPPNVEPPAQIFRTINNPTALALWDDDQDRQFAIVVGGSTHGLVKHDRDTGEIVAYLNLPAEPKDIVVDTENNWAWVSCAGAFDEPGTTPQRSGGVVMKVDLDTFAFIGGTPSGSGQHFIDAARPTFLNIEIVEGDTENIVYVAPLLSGNQTTYAAGLNGFDLQVVTATDLPDDDLFAIDESGTVSVAANNIGTLLTNHARNPASGKYWMLNVKSLNDVQSPQPPRTTEAEHRGRFADNDLTQVNVPQTSTPFKQDVPLDALNAIWGPLGGAGADKPTSFPFGLAIHSSGLAVVVSSTGDTLRVLDGTSTSGTVNTLRNVGLPEGSIPRGALLSPDATTLWVYAWGTNRILQYYAPDLAIQTTTSVNPLLYDLGVDPLPAAGKHGREIWYDADNSLDPVTQLAGQVSCNTCHPAGATDMLGWELTDPPLDRKDVMVTQSLLGIEDTFPYHWRGERSLSDFNGAFQFLLGGSQLDTDDPNDLADFEAFVFSLQGAANPREDELRMLDEAENLVHDPANSVVGSPSRGQVVFHQDQGTLRVFGGSTCADCHGGETGSNGQITFDNASVIPTNTNIDVAHLRQLQHKMFQPQLSTSLGLRPRGGWGFTQDGSDNDILDFLHPAVFFGTTPQLIQDRADAASFVAQFDEGIAPRAHDGAYFAQDSTTAELTVAGELIDQAQLGNCDLVGIGHYLSGGVPNLELRLWFDPAADVFRTSEVGTGYAFDVPTMESLRSNGYIRMVMLGLPPGNAYRFAVDPDDDGLSFLTEALFTSAFSSGTLDPWRADTDGDTYPDGYERMLYLLQSTPVSNWPDPLRTTSDTLIDTADNAAPTIVSSPALEFVTARQSKHLVSFSEPVTYEIQVQRYDAATTSFVDFGPVQFRPAVRTMDTLIAHHLQPSIDITGTPHYVRNDLYRLEVTMRDLADNTTVAHVGPSGGFQTDDNVFVDFQTGMAFLVVKEHTWDTVLTGSTGTNTWRLVLETDLDDVWEGISPTATFAQGQTIVAQVLVEDNPGSGEFVLIEDTSYGLSLTTGGNATRLVNGSNQISILGVITYGNPGDPVDGDLVLSPQTDSAGKATIDVTVTGSGLSGKRVRINLVGSFVELTTPLTFDPASAMNWQQPMTSPELRFADITL
jgi:hypothetical protein